MMMKLKLAKQLPLLLVLSLTAAPGMAQDEPIYGRQLMTEQERAEHREKMRSLSSKQEREEYRRQHHEKMQQRAKEQGVTLPEDPRQRGKGMGMGKDEGMGMGNGKGMQKNR